MVSVVGGEDEVAFVVACAVLLRISSSISSIDLVVRLHLLSMLSAVDDDGPDILK